MKIIPSKHIQDLLYMNNHQCDRMTKKVDAGSVHFSDTNPHLLLKAAVHIQVTTQNVKLTLWVGGCLQKWVICRYADMACKPSSELGIEILPHVRLS